MFISGIVIPASVYQTVVTGDGQPIQIANINVANTTQQGGSIAMTTIKNAATMQGQPITSQVATLVVNSAPQEQQS